MVGLYTIWYSRGKPHKRGITEKAGALQHIDESRVNDDDP
jgi:hypothetical protein